MSTTSSPAPSARFLYEVIVHDDLDEGWDMTDSLGRALDMLADRMTRGGALDGGITVYRDGDFTGSPLDNEVDGFTARRRPDGTIVVVADQAALDSIGHTNTAAML